MTEESLNCSLETIALQMRLISGSLEETKNNLKQINERSLNMQRQLDQLPCGTHYEKMRNIQRENEDQVKTRTAWRGLVVTNMLVIVMSIVSFAVAWGITSEKVNTNRKITSELWEHCYDKPAQKSSL